MTGKSARAFCLLFILAVMGFAGAMAQPVKGSERSATSPAPYPITSEVFTTRERTVVPEPPAPIETIFPSDISKFAANGYGQWHYGPGTDAGKQTAIMPAGYDATIVKNTARLLSFFTMSDLHLSDKESPVQTMIYGFQGGNSSSYSPVMLLTVQVLDAAIQTINALHAKKPFDFGLALGDAVHGGQYNELRWYLDVIDGKAITPDSGDKNDPVPGPSNDYQDAFKAAGLNKAIPWYQTIGNHDHGWFGAYPMTDYTNRFYTGSQILLYGDFEDYGPDTRTDYMGAVDGRTTCGTVIGAGPVAAFTVNDVLTTPTTPADANRRHLSRSQWMAEYFNTTSSPAGHGFSQANVTSDSARYTFEPTASVPIKVIVLDDTQLFDLENMDRDFLMSAQGYVNQARYDWLVSELDKGQTEGKLMIIAAHVPLSSIALQPLASTALSSTTILTKLSSYSNLIMWVCGHRHRSVVTPHPSIDPAHTGAEYAFWEVETPSLRDFPQQFRTIDILRNSDNTISIMVTDVDPAVADGSLAALSRSYAVAANDFFPITINYPPSDSYNAELIKQLSPAMQTKIQLYGTPIQSACQANFNLYK